VVSGPSGEVKLAVASPVSPGSTGCLGNLRGACIVGIDEGEFGGALIRRRPDGVAEDIVRDGFLNPVALLSNGDEALVISSCAHMSGSGGVGRLRALSSGEFEYEPWLRFRGEPAAWAYLGGRMFVAFKPGTLSACPDSLAETTLVFEPDGTFSLARGEATSCLWPGPPPP
jgi:hypothetical protein